MSRREEALDCLRLLCGDPRAEFRAGQWEAVEELVDRRARLLLVQRTGWGKSLVYFLATRLLRTTGAGPTLLVSPLLSLMRNQVDAAERAGVAAERISSDNRDAWQKIEQALEGERVDLLVVSPERLANDDFRGRVLPALVARIGLLVIDEAHCISDWGHDFRPDYLRLGALVRALALEVPVLATTATANDRVVADIRRQLGQGIRVSRGPLARPSLRLATLRMPRAAERLAWLAQHLPKLPGSGIIYTLTVRDSERVTRWLRQVGLDVQAYHAQLNDGARVAIEDALLANSVKALVATVALGMGFDKPDLGFVIHYQRPGSVVHYYQQVGRAGRALPEAFGILFEGSEDDRIQDYFIRAAFPPEGHIEEVLEVLADAPAGLTKYELRHCVNLTWRALEQVLKLVTIPDQPPVVRDGARWVRTGQPYEVDYDKIDAIGRQRQREQDRMRAYVAGERCLMQFLGDELDDPQSRPCGRCAVCLGESPIPTDVDPELVWRAAEYLQHDPQRIEPRKQWPQGFEFDAWDWHGPILDTQRIEAGRALSLWGDEGWGPQVGRGKFGMGRFSDELVAAAAELIAEHWHPPVAWVCCIPSRRHPGLVAVFAERLAAALDLPSSPCLLKTRDTAEQKLMCNSYQQCRNLDGALRVDPRGCQSGPVLLVDDMVDSRWTFTIAGALLREAGVEAVYPFALAVTTSLDGASDADG